MTSSGKVRLMHFAVNQFKLLYMIKLREDSASASFWNNDKEKNINNEIRGVISVTYETW